MMPSERRKRGKCKQNSDNESKDTVRNQWKMNLFNWNFKTCAGIIHVVRIQNFPRNLSPDAQTYVCVSGGKKW